MRYAYASLRASGVYHDIAYATIDDFRAAVGIGDTQAKLHGYTDPLTYSLTANAPHVLDLLSTADLVVVIAGDAVPSTHLHAKNGELEEVAQVMHAVQGKRVLLGPASNALRASSHPLHYLFDAYHSQNFSPETMMRGSTAPIRYGVLNSVMETFEPLLAQIPWQVIAEIELYRGCTRKQFCSFCNEPIKNRLVDFRAPEEIIREVGLRFEVTELEQDKKVRWMYRFGSVAQWAGTSVTWQLEPVHNSTTLLFTHDGFTQIDERAGGAWVFFLDSLKSYLETGKGTPGTPPFVTSGAFCII